MSIDPGTAVLTAGFGSEIGPAIRDFLGKIGSPTAEALGMIVRDEVQMFRFRRCFSIMERTRIIMRDAKLKPGEVNPKFFFPWMEHSSLETEPEMIERWAALLANVLSSSDPSMRLTILPQLLSQVSSTEAHVLEWVERGARRNMLPDPNEATLKIGPATLSGQELHIACDNLRRLGLIDIFPSEVPLIGHSKRYLEITHLGKAFLGACRNPEPDLPCPR